MFFYDNFVVKQYGIEQKKIVRIYNMYELATKLTFDQISFHAWPQNGICRNPYSDNIVFVNLNHNITFIDPENCSVAYKNIFKDREKIMET